MPHRVVWIEFQRRSHRHHRLIKACLLNLNLPSENQRLRILRRLLQNFFVELTRLIQPMLDDQQLNIRSLHRNIVLVPRGNLSELFQCLGIVAASYVVVPKQSVHRWIVRRLVLGITERLLRNRIGEFVEDGAAASAFFSVASASSSLPAFCWMTARFNSARNGDPPEATACCASASAAPVSPRFASAFANSICASMFPRSLCKTAFARSFASCAFPAAIRICAKSVCAAQFVGCSAIVRCNS